MFEVASIILGRKKYALIAVSAFAVMFGASFYLTVVGVYHKDIFVYAEMNGYLFTIATLILGFIIAVLFSIYITLLIFKKDIDARTENTKEKTGSFIGVGANMIASGCPSCGVPLLGLIGMPFGLAALPLGGIELKIASAIALLFAIKLVNEIIKKNLVCKIKS